MKNSTRVTRIMWYAGTVLTAFAMLAASATAVAQQPVHPPRARGASADSAAARRRSEADVKGFRGIAARLNTTPEALAGAFADARATNPRLSRGNFIAAHLLADNLGAQHPNITTGAILSGLQSGKSMGQTLQSLGLSSADAKQAERAANSQAKKADRRVRDADRRARAESKAAEQRSRPAADDRKPEHP